ncbi:putative sodium-coupled neutral amino acid transporter 11 [Corticium candelabrum]|uniref:putative sodium-coupled neutral amino acid transporter 11 n=1 Tax=Corticium candelabrum TaxID=121492 RepID=UPI002E25BC13|nr:putative sodium-coupled neutral amino acid transporter 11 [Corticium candelabrum]
MKFLMVMIVMLPLSLYKEIEKLGKVSAISILCVGFIVLVIIIRAGTMGPDIPVTSDGYSIARSGFFQAVGIMAFAFVCHHNSFLIYKSIQNYSIEKFSRVTHISVFVSWCACSVLGLAGYLTFTGNTEGDLLRNYCPDDVLLLVTRFLYAITIMLTFPIECFVAREVVSVLYVNIRKDGKETKLWFHILVTCGIVGLALGIALPINNLGTVLEFTGCLTATPLAFILPAAGYLKVADGRVLSQKKLPALFLFLFGLAVMLIGTVLAIIETVDDSRICDQWSYCNRTLTIVNSSSVYCVQYV